MKTKIYAIHGYTTSIIRVPAGDGKAYLSCEFTKGCPHNRTNYRPATYSTSDATEQAIIENSLMFNRLIKLWRVYEDKQPEPAVQKASGSRRRAAAVIPETQAPKETEAQAPKETEAQAPKGSGGDVSDYPEINSREGAIEILKQNGAKATDLVSDDKIAAFMAKKNITFSNFSF